ERPDDPEVQYYYGWTILDRRGPYDAWLFLKERGDLPEAPAHVRASWYALHAKAVGMLRDFERADRWLQRAMDVGAELPWVLVTRSVVWSWEDRCEEALAALDQALTAKPWFRPAVQRRAHLLTLLERDDEALQFLQQAAGQIQCAALHWQISAIHFERDEYDLALESLERYWEMVPLSEPSVAEDFYSVRSFLAYLAGNDDDALAWARRSRSEKDGIVVQRLQDPARRNRPRITLPVGFTQQHYMTCVPATLASISRFWSMPADHLQVAEEICYNGTSALAERRWAEDHGWYVREFTVTEEAAERLIHAGIPFTLTTLEPGSGHMVAVIGHDGRRGSLIIRDPNHRLR
ncbi:MAG TPA: hypothetical protein EYP14_12280, partial [Planctomycetaceae bacterium]|nr:hypothetical protein [Planctomycetaceae bacterium]